MKEIEKTKEQQSTWKAIMNRLNQIYKASQVSQKGLIQASTKSRENLRKEYEKAQTKDRGKYLISKERVDEEDHLAREVANDIQNNTRFCSMIKSIKKMFQDIKKYQKNQNEIPQVSIELKT